MMWQVCVETSIVEVCFFDKFMESELLDMLVVCC